MNIEALNFSSNGTRCDADYYRPDGIGPHPCVVMAHGFGGIRAAGLGRFAERFAKAGLAALVFDYRHFGTSGGEPRGLIDISRQQADWRAAIAFARGLSTVDPQRIALWGTSFSGGHVLTVAAEDAQIAAAIIQNPFVDGPPTVIASLRATTIRNATRLWLAYFRDELRQITHLTPHRVDLVGPPGALAVFTTLDAEPGYRALLPSDAVGWADAVPARVFRQVLTSRPIKHAAQVRCPLLVVVCDEDLITPAKPAARVAELAPFGDLRRYRVGHFGLYDGEGFERVVHDEITFLEHALVSPPLCQ